MFFAQLCKFSEAKRMRYSRAYLLLLTKFINKLYVLADTLDFIPNTYM